MDYIQHFNKQTANYLAFRPNYPDVLYDYLSTLVKIHEYVWDCGTGNGQAAVALAKHFELVIATDINQGQLNVAPKQETIHYVCCAAENSPILDKSIDLITIAQALHWFNFDLFYKEVCRVSKSSAIIAAWCYSLGKFDSALDPIIEKLYHHILGDEYWPSERRYIDKEYRTIPFPFDKIASPAFILEKSLMFNQFIGYLNTWSAVKEFQIRNQSNPINLIYKKLESAWGEPSSQHIIRWPLHLLVGRVNKINDRGMTSEV